MLFGAERNTMLCKEQDILENLAKVRKVTDYKS